MFTMDDFNMNTDAGTSWRLYVVVGILAVAAIVTAVAYAVSYFGPSH
jgi:hypothetical protein